MNVTKIHLMGSLFVAGLMMLCSVKADTITFQHGVNGYSGCIDSYINYEKYSYVNFTPLQGYDNFGNTPSLLCHAENYGHN